MQKAPRPEEKQKQNKKGKQTGFFAFSCIFFFFVWREKERSFSLVSFLGLAVSLFCVFF